MGACFAALPSCGGGGNLGIKHTEFWTTAVTKLMSGLHGILDDLYGPVETGITTTITITNGMAMS